MPYCRTDVFNIGEEILWQQHKRNFNLFLREMICTSYSYAESRIYFSWKSILRRGIEESTKLIPERKAVTQTNKKKRKIIGFWPFSSAKNFYSSFGRFWRQQITILTRLQARTSYYISLNKFPVEIFFINSSLWYCFFAIYKSYFL